MLMSPIRVVWVLTIVLCVAYGDKILGKKSQVANFLAGGLAGTVSSTITIPLEVVKTQLQSSRIAGKSSVLQVTKTVYRTEGIKGFFRGLTPLLIGIIPTRALYFWAYTTSKSRLTGPLGEGSPVNHLLSAFAAGITSNTIMNPLWMVKTRFQIIADETVGQRAFKGYREVVQTIWKEEGLQGFYKGLSASYIGCFEGAIQWITYEKIKSALLMKKRISSNDAEKHLSPAEYFLSAAAAKFVAIAATYPHEVVRTRLREQATNGAFKYSGFLNTLSVISREEGLRGLYGGMGIHLAKSVPNAAVMFVSFEVISRWIESHPNALDFSLGKPQNPK